MKKLLILGLLVLGCSGESESTEPEYETPIERILAEQPDLRNDPEAMMAVLRNDSDVQARHEWEQMNIPTVEDSEEELADGYCEVKHMLLAGAAGSGEKGLSHEDVTRCAPGTELPPVEKAAGFNYSGLIHDRLQYTYAAQGYPITGATQFGIMAMNQEHLWWSNLVFTSRNPAERAGGPIFLQWQKMNLGALPDGRIILGQFRAKITSSRIFQSAKIVYDMVNLATWVGNTAGATMLDAEAVTNLHEMGHFMGLGDLNFAAPFPPQYSTVMNYQANNCLPTCMTSWHYSPEEVESIEGLSFRNLRMR